MKTTTLLIFLSISSLAKAIEIDPRITQINEILQSAGDGTKVCREDTNICSELLAGLRDIFNLRKDKAAKFTSAQFKKGEFMRDIKRPLQNLLSWEQLEMSKKKASSTGHSGEYAATPYLKYKQKQHHKQKLSSAEELSALLFLKKIYKERFSEELNVKSIADAEKMLLAEEQKREKLQLERFQNVDFYGDYDEVHLENYVYENVRSKGNKDGDRELYLKTEETGVPVKWQHGDQTDEAYGLASLIKNGGVSRIFLNLSLVEPRTFNHLNEDGHDVRGPLEYGKQSMGPTMIHSNYLETYSADTSFEIENCKIKKATIRTSALAMGDEIIEVGPDICKTDTNKTMQIFCEKLAKFF